MGKKYKSWQPLYDGAPNDYNDLAGIIRDNRSFMPVDQLSYGDYGLNAASEKIIEAIQSNKKIAFYADYDVDGTMSLVSWVWFLEALGYKNYTYYIPCRFTEGYGLNMEAVKLLVEKRKAQMVITMDTGITANDEAAYCKANGIDFICTDHHKVQKEKMPDCIIVNPKLHPMKEYQELCGCGVTFVVLRKIAQKLKVPNTIWKDLMALAGMATICDVVALNTGVNHSLAKKGIEALMQSKRPIFKKLLESCQNEKKADESDIGFRVGPRINAVGRLDHADIVLQAFLGTEPDIHIQTMEKLNEKRKQIQNNIIEDASRRAKQYEDDPILFIGCESWHQGVVGICASKIKDDWWKPVWLFQEFEDGTCKGSSRSIEGFDVTEAMAQSCAHLFTKFGGHKAAAGFSFPKKNIEEIRRNLIEYANKIKGRNSLLWDSKIVYDCKLPLALCDMASIDSLEGLKPFGHQFEKPKFLVEGVVDDIKLYYDKATNQPRHTALFLTGKGTRSKKIMFFNEVLDDLPIGSAVEAIVGLDKNYFNGNVYVNMIGSDIRY